jgi:mycofactocin precursor
VFGKLRRAPPGSDCQQLEEDAMANDLTVQGERFEPATAEAAIPAEGNVEPTLAEEELVDEISIDGMCGVY